MITPQSRKEKIRILKEAANGNYKTLRTIADEQNKRRVSGTNITLCFYYLLEHGRPDGYQGAIKYQTCSITSMEDFEDIESGLNTIAETGDYQKVSSAALIKLLECMECYRLLKENGLVHLLKPYENNLIGKKEAKPKIPQINQKP